jgi:hypothetical protein
VFFIFGLDAQLCERIVCQNRGVCAIRNPDGPTKSVCLCRYGTSGDYCELTGEKFNLPKTFFLYYKKLKLGTLGYCEAGFCMNNAACEEIIIGSTRHAYCVCPPGYNGIKCEYRKLIILIYSIE